MISSKKFLPDGSTSRFLSEFIIPSEQHVRVYGYVYDPINGSDTEDIVDPVSGFYIRKSDLPLSNDYVGLAEWDLVDNSISFYTAPTSNSTIVIEVATTPEEFGDVLVQTSVERAENARDAAEAAQVAAEAAQAGAETAQAGAESAQAGAEAAQAGAELAETNAETAETNINTKLGTLQSNGSSIEDNLDTITSEPVATQLANAQANSDNATTKAAEAAASASAAEASNVESEYWAGISQSGKTPVATRNTVISDGPALALATTPTHSFATVTYTGNGTSQDVFTGIESKDANWSISGKFTVEGAEKVSNGTFDTDTSGWLPFAGGSVTQVNGRIRIDGAGAYAAQAISTVAGYTYNVTADMFVGTASSVALYISTSSDFLDYFAFTSDSTSADFSFTATQATTYILLRQNTGHAGYVEFDNVSVKAEEPRYDIGDYVIEDYVIYQNLTGAVGTSPLSADTTNWQVVADGVSVAHPNAQVWIKSRSGAYDNVLFDTIRGVGKDIRSNTTGAESTNPVHGYVSSFNQDGFTITQGATSASLVNAVGTTYVAWCTYYDTMVSGTTNHGKRYITAYNAQSGEGMVIYEGSGTAGHEIPHYMGTTVEFITTKARDTATINSWVTGVYENGISQGGLALNSNVGYGTLAAPMSSTDDRVMISSFTYTDYGNQSGINYVAYFSSNRSGHTFTTTYQGTGAAGNVIKLPFDMTQSGASVMIKRLNGVGSWEILDTIRGSGASLYADLSIAEASDTLFTATETGITINSTGGTANASGGQYLITATIPTYAKPNGGLATTTPTVTYAKGTDPVTGDINSVETLTAQDFTLTSGATNYLYVDEGDTKGSTTVAPYYGTSRDGATGDFYNINEGKMYDSTNTPVNRVYLGEAYVDGTGEYVPDTLIEYDHRKQYGTSMVLTDDLEVRGKLSGMSGFDLGQKWYDVTAERFTDVTYTNTTGRPILVSIVGVASTAATDWRLGVDGIAQIDRYHNADTVPQKRAQLKAIVPPNSTYYLNKVTGTMGVSGWLELR